MLHQRGVARGFAERGQAVEADAAVEGKNVAVGEGIERAIRVVIVLEIVARAHPAFGAGGEVEQPRARPPGVLEVAEIGGHFVERHQLADGVAGDFGEEERGRAVVALGFDDGAGGRVEEAREIPDVIVEEIGEETRTGRGGAEVGLGGGDDGFGHKISFEFGGAAGDASATGREGDEVAARRGIYFGAGNQSGARDGRRR